MKPVTQERILKAHERRSGWIDSKPEIKIHRHFVLYGINSLVPTPQREKCGQTLSLELNFAGAFDVANVSRRLAQAGISSQQVELEMKNKCSHLPQMEAYCIAGWLLLWDYRIKRSWKISDKITEIQEKYGVSGLADKTVELGYSTITIKEPHDSLALISSDHKILAEQRFEIGKVFVRALHSNGMKLYQRIDEPRDGWAEVKNSDAALAAIAGCDWATIWSNSYFINRKELRSKGLTHRNSLPLSSDHEQEWEIHLSCGTGEYTESIDDDNIRYWFCAYRGTTGLAL